MYIFKILNKNTLIDKKEVERGEGGREGEGKGRGGGGKREGR
jgi:hypothetical protein